MDGAGRRINNFADSSHLLFARDTYLRSYLLHAIHAELPFVLRNGTAADAFFPGRVSETRSPPVGMSFLVEQPQLAGVLGKKILARESLGNGKTLGALADQHDVTSVLHSSLRDLGDVLNIANATNRPRAASGTVHAAGVEFNHPFFVGQTAEADTIVVRIIFRTSHHPHRGIESIGAAAEHTEGFLDIRESVGRRDDNGALAG